MTRTAEVKRKTKETDITLQLNLDGSGQAEIQTGLGFFDHMLNTLAKHSGMDLKIKAIGDLEVDEHHTMEDVGICLGQAITEALGDKKGIQRFGWALCPMDESLARVAIDLGGRTHFEWQMGLPLTRIGEIQTESFPEFFKAVASTGGMNLHMDLIRGKNLHHALEAMFKAFAQTLKMALSDTGTGAIPSTKGSL